MNAADTAMLAKLSPDLRFVFCEREVPVPIQVAISAAGLRTLGLFVSFVDNKAGLRAAMATQFNIDPSEAGIGADEKRDRQITLAKLVDSWDSASKRRESIDQVQADQKASRLPITLSRSQHITLRQRYETEFGRTQDKCWPCQHLIEKRFEEVEEGESKADPLSDVASAEEVAEDVIGAVMDKDGAIRMKKVARTVPLPGCSESLRTRIRILGITYHLASYKHSSRLWLATTSPDIWRDHVDYVLGDDIHGFSIQAAGFTVTVPWDVVLSYEFQIRKQACRLVMFENMDIATALVKARKDTEVKEKYFSTPVSLFASVGGKRKNGQGDSSGSGFVYNTGSVGMPGAGKNKRFKGQGKGNKGQKGGGNQKKGNAKGKGKKNFPKTKTPDGRLICYKFQDANCPHGAQCTYVHVCANCLGDHSMNSCPIAIAWPASQ